VFDTFSVYVEKDDCGNCADLLGRVFKVFPLSTHLSVAVAIGL
jgi:hypothetical protein